MYLSTEEITVCTMDIGPGGMFDPPDIHPGDETYYILEGSITILNPLTGQSAEVREGEAVLIPKGALHSGYNFQDKTVKVLAVIAPLAHDKSGVSIDTNVPKKILFHDRKNFSAAGSDFCFSNKAGTVDDIGSWPEQGELLRKNSIIYPINEQKKLRVIHGNSRPVLVKFAVSNEFASVGELILPVGGQTASYSEPLKHHGETFLFARDGDITVELMEKEKVYALNAYDGLYLPPKTEYRLINYSSKMINAIFAVTGKF
jgi:gentisate 1,2-dioxygenase